MRTRAVKRLGQPEDLTALAMLLSSDASSFITGQTITADGGALCM
jgi:NAD(P)-dependent dehydrogenase (short-subunit alcohol dehydrogenase family)